MLLSNGHGLCGIVLLNEFYESDQTTSATVGFGPIGYTKHLMDVLVSSVGDPRGEGVFARTGPSNENQL